MTCKRCGAPINSGSKFCLNCGLEVDNTCPSCGAHNTNDRKYCINCGWPLEMSGDDVQPEPGHVAVPKTKTANTGLIIAVVVLGFIVIALITIILGNSLRQNNDAEPKSVPVATENASNSATQQSTSSDSTTQNSNYSVRSSSSQTSAPSTSTTSSSAVSLSTPIMGNSGTTKQELIDLYNSNALTGFPQYYENRGVYLSDFVDMYLEECATENVRADLAFSQMALETGWLKFGGDVSITQFNFAGIGATGGGEPGYDFAATYGDNENGIRMGIRAQIQHLKAYGSTASLNNSVVDPRFDLVDRGSSPTIGGLSGTWSTNSDFAAEIVDIIHRI